MNFSELRNGYIKRWIRDYIQSETHIKASLNFKISIQLNIHVCNCYENFQIVGNNRFKLQDFDILATSHRNPVFFFHSEYSVIT